MTDADRGALALFAIGLTLIMLLIVAALYVGGVFDASPTPSAAPLATPSASRSRPSNAGGATPTYTNTTPTETTSAESTQLGSTKTYDGRSFTIAYPTDWDIEYSEQNHSWGNDTTIVSPTEEDTLLRVDISPNTSAASPRAAAQPVIQTLQQQPTYHLIALSPDTLDGQSALDWEFTVTEGGVTLHKQDVFLITTSGTGIAVLTQAPQARYEELRPSFAKLRESLTAN